MKIFKFLAVAFVAMLGFTACDKDCDHDFIEHDHSADLVGTWTCLTPDFVEALVISADGKVVSTGIAAGEYWENVNGTVATNDGTITLTFEDDDNFEGHFDIIPGKAFSIYNDKGGHLVFNYCANDLSDEIVGLWVCNDAPNGINNDISIISYEEDGSTTFTGILPNSDDYMVKLNTTYKVVGDLMFKKNADQGTSNSTKYIATRLTYIPNGTDAGDIMVYQHYLGTEEKSSSYLRIKQNLDLVNKSYDYNNIYVTNVKAKDAEFEFAGQTLNLANMDGRILDKMMKTLLFNVSFPSADKIVYNYHYNGENVHMPSPIVVDGNKMTIKKSVNNPACKDIDVWTFQDQDNTQMHMYMPVKSFENFLANTVVEMMANEGKLDLNDAAAVKAIFDQVEAAIETINVSFIFKSAK